MKITHLVNPNGYGHLRRAIFFWSRVKAEIDLEIWIDHSQVQTLEYFNHSLRKNIVVKDFSGMITLKSIKTIDFYRKYKELHESIEKELRLKTSNIIISDNTLINFKVFPQAQGYILGSFLWSDLDLPQEIIKEEQKIISLNQIELIGINNFISTRNESISKLETGWFIDKKKYTCTDSKNIILFSGGLGEIPKDAIFNYFGDVRRLFPKYEIHASHKYQKVLSDTKSFSFKTGDWEKVYFCIGRPGIGTISDCINYNIPLIAIGEISNQEIRFNAQKIEELNIGMNYLDKSLDENILKTEFTGFSAINREGVKDLKQILGIDE